MREPPERTLPPAPGSERPDVLETLRGFLARPFDALLRGKPALPEETAALETPLGLMEIWRRGLSVWAPSPPCAQLDSVTAVGQWTELVAQIPPLQRPRTESVRFLLDGVEAGVAPYREGALAYLAYRPQQAGIFSLTFERLDRRGRVIGSSDTEPHDLQRLHVVTTRPVAIVDVDVLLSDVSGVAEWLRYVTSAAVGWQLLYLERSGQERRALVHARVDAWELPRGALLVHHPETRLGKLDEAHAPALVEAEIRRLRADGVPLTVFVAHDAKAPASLAHEVSAVDVPRPVLDALGVAPSLWPKRKGRQHGMSATALKRVEAAAARHQRAFAHRKSDVGFRLDQMTPATAVAGHAVHLELDNRAAREAVFAAIEGSRHTIELQCYIFEPSAFAAQLAVRLIRRARAGVRVSLMVDALYSRQEVLGAVNPILDGLAKEPGIEVRATKPIPTFGSMDVRAMKERDHRKLIVVDGERAFVSGRNVGDAYYSGFDEVPIADFTEHERIPWLDAHVELRGPLVGAVRRAFLQAFVAAGASAQVRGPRDVPAGLDPAKVKAPPAVGPDVCRLVLHDGVEDAYGLTAYEALIDAAREQVHVVNAFPVFDRLRDTIARAVRRGVDVHLLTGCALTRRADGTFFAGGLHRELFEYMLKQRLEELMRVGVHVYEYETRPSPNIVSRGGVVRPYVHAKMLVVDGVALSVGSANLDATASFWEREANVIIEGGALPVEAQRLLRELCARSHRVDLDAKTWRSEAGSRELVARLWPTSLYS